VTTVQSARPLFFRIRIGFSCIFCTFLQQRIAQPRFEELNMALTFGLPSHSESITKTFHNFERGSPHSVYGPWDIFSDRPCFRPHSLAREPTKRIANLCGLR